MTASNGNAFAHAPDEPPTILYIGHHESQRQTPVSVELIQNAQYAGYDLISAPITKPHFQSRVLTTLREHVDALATKGSKHVPMPLISPLTPLDTDFAPAETNLSLIAVTSSWIDLASSDPLIAHVSRQVLNLEIAYAAFCGISNVIVQGPVSNRGTAQYARSVREALGLGPYIQLQILLPMTGELEEGPDGTHLGELARSEYLEGDFEDDGEFELYESWEIWNSIRQLCEYNTRLSIALELPRQLPSATLQSRWFSEPVRLLNLPRTSFLRNAKGFPVLSKPHQQYLTRFLRLRTAPWVLLSDVGTIPEPACQSIQQVATMEPTPAEAAANPKQPEDPIGHLRYMRHLQQTQPPRPMIERFGQGYQDYLQSPLQPLTDNLESITYEVFEKDPVKYDSYQQACVLALKDLREKLGKDREINVAVVGAGRGPLMTGALRASKQTGIKVRCWAVEKNLNAYVHLQRKAATEELWRLWGTPVTVVKSDMRAWSGPVLPDGTIGKVDILISELLGSFADNELSPECLDGIQHVLNPDHGVSIPQSYTAHFTPIAAPRLYSDILGRSSTDLNMTVAEKWDLPYVVLLHQYDDLALQQQTVATDSPLPEIKEAWEFSHPIAPEILEQAKARAGGGVGTGGWVGGDGSNEHNFRSCVLRFKCQNRGVCHGLGGYFESVLYAQSADNEQAKKVELSTNPLTMDQKSQDMISWFPIFFPLKTPIHVPDGGELEVSMWRQTDDRKVWYEWVVELFETEEIRIDGGEDGASEIRTRRKRLGSSELHSSRKNGCLM
ncbi:protein arginine n-methyltransferase skb1 [Acrodontium crateriforme]|uniref:Protein arginine N-methyltransferase n=1 Tax=Acrodontium crateriforme TaxID=150365 RepID=A0AAQ3R7K0_9PEZI|nr:protein arginine n-methyltransferase skb1 [Acrodontium crateriforme]